MDNLGTTPAGTTWICARCVKPYQYRRASEHVPERRRIRVGVCASCKPAILELVAKNMKAINEAVNAAGNVRLLFPHRR